MLKRLAGLSLRTGVAHLLLPLAAMLAVLFSPIALVLHVETGHADQPASSVDCHDRQGEPAGSKHHDSARCSVCSTVSSLKQFAGAEAFVFLVSTETPLEFYVPAYIAPSTQEPAIAISVPRGPPLSV